jgi:acylphosphatase
MVHGWPADVAAILNWARRGPPGAHVVSMQVNEASGEYAGFERWPSA